MKVPAAVTSWLGAAVISGGLSWGFFDHIAIESYGASARTLRAFIKSYHDLMGAIRDVVIPDPDLRIA